MATSALLTALHPDVDTTLRRVLRLAALVAISVTGVVYHLLLAGLVEMTPAGAFADTLVHTVVPLLAVLGWLAFGPRGAHDVARGRARRRLPPAVARLHPGPRTPGRRVLALGR